MATRLNSAGHALYLRDIRDQHTNRFGFDFYVQLPLAFIFLSAKTGDLPTALAALETYQGWKVTEDLKVKLDKLVRNLDPVNTQRSGYDGDDRCT